MNYPGLHKKQMGLVTKVKNNEIEVLLINNKDRLTIDNEKIKQAKWINNGPKKV